jgi:hypothetical protein
MWKQNNLTYFMTTATALLTHRAAAPIQKKKCFILFWNGNTVVPVLRQLLHNVNIAHQTSGSVNVEVDWSRDLPEECCFVIGYTADLITEVLNNHVSATRWNLYLYFHGQEVCMRPLGLHHLLHLYPTVFSHQPNSIREIVQVWRMAKGYKVKLASCTA